MMEMDFKMHNDLGLGFICKNARTSSKPTLRKVTFPVSAYETSKLSLTGFQCPTACRFPFFVLCMIIHNHLSSACPITQNECSNHISQFSIDIKVQDWLSRSRVAFIDFHNLRNTDKTTLITVNHLEALLTVMSTTLVAYVPYSKKRLNFSFLNSFTLSKTSQSYTLTFPVVLSPLLDALGDFIQECITEKLLKRRNSNFMVYEYLKRSGQSSHKVKDINNDLQLKSLNIRLMSVLTGLSQQGLISFICEGKRGDRRIEELQFIPYVQRTYPEVLTFEEWISLVD